VCEGTPASSRHLKTAADLRSGSLLRVANILLLSGTGFIGSPLVAELASVHSVTVFHRGETEPEIPNVRHVHGAADSMLERMDSLIQPRPDVVVDMVPYLRKSDEHAFLHFRGIASRGIVISSVDVYRAFARLWRSEPGDPDPVPLSEDAPLRSTSAPDFGDESINFDNLEVEDSARREESFPVTILRAAGRLRSRR
jgi:hypothetical protein